VTNGRKTVNKPIKPEGLPLDWTTRSYWIEVAEGELGIAFLSGGMQTTVDRVGPKGDDACEAGFSSVQPFFLPTQFQVVECAQDGLDFREKWGVVRLRFRVENRPALDYGTTL
jgi:hypothetical protein